MFPLSNGKLIRVNKDGSDGEIISSNKTTMVFGTSPLNDYFIRDADPKLNIHCEISTDEYGRVSITNKSSNDILLNDKQMTSVRPLFNNSIIEVCNGIQFRWQYKQAKENIGTDLNEADFASWSDPAKKNSKQSRLTKKEKQKGRLTAHPLHIFSTKNMDSQSLNSLNESVCTAANSAEIDGEPVVQSDTTIQSDVTQTTDIQAATMPVAETDISIVKSQLSNCSIITVSSDGGRDDTVDIAIENKDESIEIFDHTILPSSQESQNDVSKCDPAIEISLLATPITSDEKRAASTSREFNTTNLIDFDSTMNITNTKDENSSTSLTPCPRASIIPEKNDERIEAMINTEYLFEDSETDNDKENVPIESTETGNDATIESDSVAYTDDAEGSNGDQQQPEQISSSTILCESVSKPQEKMQLNVGYNEMDKIETPLIPASELDTSAESGEALNLTNSENLAQNVEEHSSEHGGKDSINESPVMNGTSEKDESFIPETQFDASIDFEEGGDSVDNETTEPKTATESESQIENEKSFETDAIEIDATDDLILVSEEQEGLCESHEMVNNGLVSNTGGESITETSDQTEIVLAESADDTNQDDDEEIATIQSIEAENDTTIDNDSNSKEEQSDRVCLEQPEEILSSHILSEKESQAQPVIEMETECTEIANFESAAVSSGELVEALNVLDAESSAQAVSELSFTHDANQSVIETAATNETSEEDDSIVPETQFDTTNDFEMKLNNSKPFTNDHSDSYSDDAILLPKIQNDSCENDEMISIDEFIKETSDQIENKETQSEDSDSVDVYESQTGTDEVVGQENCPIELTETKNATAIEKDSNVEEEKSTNNDPKISSSLILNENDNESPLVTSSGIAEASNGFEADKSVECSVTDGITENDESFIPETQCDFEMESNKLDGEETEPNESQIDNENTLVIECDDSIAMLQSSEMTDDSSAPKTEDEMIVKSINETDSAELFDENSDLPQNDEEKIQEDVVPFETEEISTNGATEDSLSLPVHADEGIVDNGLVADSTVLDSGEESNEQISNEIELKQPMSESCVAAETQDDASHACEMINNNSESDESLTENNGTGDMETKTNESLKKAESDVSTNIASVSEISNGPENDVQEASFVEDSEIAASEENEDMHCVNMDHKIPDKLQDSFFDTSYHDARTESSAVSSMLNDSAQLTEDTTPNHSLSKAETSKESGLERSDDEFDLPTRNEIESTEVIDEKLCQIDSFVSKLKQMNDKNQTHLNSITDDPVLSTHERITSTDNADVETKSESENNSIDVKDFELTSTSEKMLPHGDASIVEPVFDLDDFLNSQETTIVQTFTKSKMSTNDVENATITTPSNTQTANDSESYNLCDFSIESEPSLIAKNELSIKQESDLSTSGTDDQIDDKLIDDAMDESEKNDNKMVCDSIEENISANDKLVKLISDIYVENNEENVTNIPNSTSEELKTSDSDETIACETIIEVKNLEPATEETNENILKIEVDASIMSNGHSTRTNEVDKDFEHLSKSEAVEDDQTPTETESIAATNSEIGQSTSILDNVDGEDSKPVSDQLIKGETTSELEISSSESTFKTVIDVANTPMNDDILVVKDDAIEHYKEISASSDQYVSSPTATMPVNRSISEATTVSRTISDDIEMKVDLTPVKLSKPSTRSTVIDDPNEGIFTKAYVHHFGAINTPLVNVALCNIEPSSGAKKATRSTKKEAPADIDFEQIIEATLVERQSKPKESEKAPSTPLVNKNLKNVDDKPSPRRTRSASKSSKSDKNETNVILDSVQKDIMKNVNVALDIEKQLKTPIGILHETTELRSSSKRNVKSVSTRKIDSEIEIPNSSDADMLDTPRKCSTDESEPEIAPQTPLINKNLQIIEPRSSARRKMRSAFATKEVEEKEIESKASASTTDTPNVAPQTPVTNKNSQAVEPRSSIRRNVKTASSTKKDEEDELNNKNIAAIIDTPKVRSNEKAEPEVAPQTPAVNECLKAVECRSSARRNVRSAYASKETVKKEMIDETTATAMDTPKLRSNENAEPEVAPRTPVVSESSKAVECRSSARRNVRSAHASKETVIKEVINETTATAMDTPKLRSNENAESEVAPQTPAVNESSKAVECRSSARRNVRSAHALKETVKKEMIDETSATAIDKTPKVPVCEQTEPEVAPQTPLVNKHLQIGGSRSSARRNVRSAYATKESEEKKLDASTSNNDSKIDATSIDTPKLPLSKQTESDAVPQTPVANKSLQVVEPRSSKRRNVKSTFATKVCNEEELDSKATSTAIETPKMRSNDNVEPSVKRSARINKKDNAFASAFGEVYTQFETPKKGSNDTNNTVREPAAFEPEALSTPVCKSLQGLHDYFSAKPDAGQGSNVQKDSNSFVTAVDSLSTTRIDSAKRSTNDKNGQIETKPADIDTIAPATPLVNKNLRLVGTRSSAKRGRSAHNDVMDSTSKSLKLDTTELKFDAATIDQDSITEQVTPQIKKSIHVPEQRSSSRRNVKSVYATKTIEPSTSNINVSCAEKESDILQRAMSNLNEVTISAIQQPKIEDDPMNSSLGMTNMLKTPVAKKVPRKNAAKQKTVNKMAVPCVADPKIDTIIENVSVGHSPNNSLSLTPMKTPTVQSTYGRMDSWPSVRDTKSNTKSTTIQPLKSQCELSSPEKISEMLKSPVAYTSSLVVNPGSSTNNSKMVKLLNTTPNKGPNHAVVNMPSTSGISPNKATPSRISGQNSMNVLKKVTAVRTPHSSKKIIGQSPVKSLISPSIKGYTPVSMANTSSGSFVPYQRPSQNSFVNRSPVESSYSFSSTGMPNNLQNTNNTYEVGKTYFLSGTPNPSTHKSFTNQSTPNTSNALNSIFEVPKTMIVNSPVQRVFERKSFTGADGLHYRTPLRGGPSIISPMKSAAVRQNFTPNSVSPHIQVGQRHPSTPNTIPPMNKMLPVQFASQSTNARCRKIDFDHAGNQMEMHQNQVARNTPNTSRANSSYMMSSTPQSVQLLPSRISQGYPNSGQLSTQQGTMMTSPRVLNTKLMSQSSNSYDQHQFLQVLNTSVTQKNLPGSNLTKQSPSINDFSNQMNKPALDIQSLAMQTAATAQTARPAKRRGKQIDMQTEGANGKPVQCAIETETKTRGKRAKKASVDVLPDQPLFMPTGTSNESNMNNAVIQPQIDNKSKRGKRKPSKDEKPTEVEEMKTTSVTAASQIGEMNMDSAAILPQITAEKPKRGKRKPSKDEKPTEVEEAKPKRGRQKKNEPIESSSSTAMVQELPPIVENPVKPKRGGRRQNSATETVNIEPSHSIEIVHHLQDVPQEPIKTKRGGRHQNNTKETVNVEPIPEVIDEKPGRRVLRKRTIDEAPPAPELAKTIRSKRNAVEPIVEMKEPIADEKPKRGRRKAVQSEIPTVCESIDIPLSQSSNVKNGNQKKVQFQDELPTHGSQDNVSTHETSIKLNIEPVDTEKKTTRKRTPKPKVVESDEDAYEAPRTRRGRKPEIEAVQEPAEETKMTVNRPRRAAKKP